MKKALNILLIVVSIAIIAFVVITLAGVSIIGTKTDSEYFEKQTNSTQMESMRIFYVHAEDSVDAEMLTNKIPFKLNVLNKDDLVIYNYISLPDSFQNENSYFNIKTNTLFYGENEYEKTIANFLNSKKLSELNFDLYELKESKKVVNNFILFNEDYGILSCEYRNLGLKYLFFPEQLVDSQLQNEIIKMLYKEQLSR
ncbi:hypothetical protein [Ichthyenterobacterium magnum]|uniref:Uncharacterized protein n=1 Tax=Ichthyenterobacterium magnum TaxID=1230530 RepID=A0A420DED8_9FLAO|nr:hypothetical protein [Ichthyenterobacterium magnum]RKE90295.1 hypothetical protein BXY80_2762 [Ichthyenterobacterium magnum]